jgi:hypothetical protein
VPDWQVDVHHCDFTATGFNTIALAWHLLTRQTGATTEVNLSQHELIIGSSAASCAKRGLAASG